MSQLEKCVTLRKMCYVQKNLLNLEKRFAVKKKFDIHKSALQLKNFLQVRKAGKLENVSLVEKCVTVRKMCHS